MLWYTKENNTSGIGAIPYRRYSPRAIWLIRFDSEADSYSLDDRRKLVFPLPFGGVLFFLPEKRRQHEQTFQHAQDDPNIHAFGDIIFIDVSDRVSLIGECTIS